MNFLVKGLTVAVCMLPLRTNDDIYSIMLEDSDMFYANLEQLGYEPEDFTNAKFRME